MRKYQWVLAAALLGMGMAACDNSSSTPPAGGAGSTPHAQMGKPPGAMGKPATGDTMAKDANSGTDAAAGSMKSAADGATTKPSDMAAPKTSGDTGSTGGMGTSGDNATK